MPTWLLFLILLVIILIIVWILLSGSPIVEDTEETAVVEAVEEPVASEMVAETPEETAVEKPPAEERAVGAMEFHEVVEPVEEINVTDDLKKIEGIGPKISTILAEKGISTFSQLADKDAEELKAILDEAKIRIANPSTWAEQAKLAADGAWDSLEKLQEELKGGRRESK